MSMMWKMVMMWKDRVLTWWPGGRCESLDLFWGSDVGQVVSSSGQGLDIVLLSILSVRLRKSEWSWILILAMEVIWSTHFKFMTNYFSIYFSAKVWWQCIGWHQGTSKLNFFCEGYWPTYLARPFCSTWPVSIVRAGCALEGCKILW